MMRSSFETHYDWLDHKGRAIAAPMARSCATLVVAKRGWRDASPVVTSIKASAICA
jgi:hypothetical protein